MSMLSLLAHAYEQADYGMEFMAVPDFIGGIIYGMTGYNHLEEIEGCYHGSIDVVEDAQKAFHDIEHGDMIKGFAAIGKIVHEFPTTLSTCKGMDSDLDAIRSWATIFTQPKKLAETVGKNMLLHRRTIKDEISKEQQDWANKAYFQAGVDTAIALTEAIGKIETPKFEVNAAVVSVP